MNDSIFSNRGSKLKEFSRLRDLMVNASRPTSTALSSIFMEENPGSNQSVFHYDIRDADSLMEESSIVHARDMSVVALDKVSLVSIPDDVPGRVFKPPTQTNSSSQTCGLSAAMELEELRSDLLPRLEEQLSTLEISASGSDEKCRRLTSRIRSCILFDYVSGSIPEVSENGSFFLSADSLSIDVFRDASDEAPLLSIPLRGSSLRVSAKTRELSFLSLKTLRFIINVGDMDRFKKLLFTFKLLGLPVSIIDVPQEMSGKLPTDNPRRQLARDV